MSDHALFAVAPLVSIAVLIVVAALRWRPDTFFSGSASPPRATARRRAFTHRLPAIGFYGLLAGHVIVVAWPDQLLRWSRNLFRLMAFELTLFAFGALALAGVVVAVRRRVLERTDGGGLADAALLGVLLVTLLSGTGIAIAYRWAAVWSAVTVTPYARALLHLRPNVEPIEAMPYLVKLHIFSSFVVVGLLAFTRSIDAVLLPLRRAIGTFVAPLVSSVDRRCALLLERALESGRRVMWPEEDD
jgi:nitrate reductase gamma subunit